MSSPMLMIRLHIDLAMCALHASATAECIVRKILEMYRYEVELARMPCGKKLLAHFLQEILRTATADKAACLHAYIA